MSLHVWFAHSFARYAQSPVKLLQSLRTCCCSGIMTDILQSGVAPVAPVGPHISLIQWAEADVGLTDGCKWDCAPHIALICLHGACQTYARYHRDSVSLYSTKEVTAVIGLARLSHCRQGTHLWHKRINCWLSPYQSVSHGGQPAKFGEMKLSCSRQLDAQAQ